MITVKIDKKAETVTYSTLINIDGKLISLRVTRYLYYQKPYQLDHSLPLPKDLTERKVTLFEDLFYWSEECYTKPELNHLAYFRISESNFYYQSRKSYEINWEEIKVQLDPKNNGVLILSNKTDWHPVAIPPGSSGLVDVIRYDYITDDKMYHYNCKQGEHRGIEIILNGTEKIINW